MTIQIKQVAYVCALSLFPLVAQAKWSVEGTPDGNGDGHGDLQRGQTYEFGVKPKDSSLPDGKMLGVSSIMGEWWTASSSGSPWDEFVDYPNVDVQPSFHITDALYGGDSFFVGLSMQNQMRDYTSEFRMANDVFGAGADFYFGLRNVTEPSVLETWSQAEYDELVSKGKNLPIVDGVQQLVGDPKFTNGHITDHQGLLYQGHSTGVGNLNHTPDTDSFDVSMFEWTHFQTDSIDDDITFTIKDDGASKVLELTEWVLFINLPDTMSPIAGEQWGEVPIDDASRQDDVVFSWTVDGKDGYTLDPVTGDPLENPTFDDPDSGIFRNVPEPSSSILLLGGAAMLLNRRQRRQV